MAAAATQSLPPRGRWHGEAVTEEGNSGEQFSHVPEFLENVAAAICRHKQNV